ncbi:hypothetical protein BDN72DRAFT_887503 [Pluteus cervinus]|uniref:Uncharacterized protein n=1 Tax=Pluteus cervinus TaxID=181527 RepID=A0ACD3B2I2_9AGAR|nr:hypothetical protein BDN72DRAFT_887503 [Pluteus cervinus]
MSSRRPRNELQWEPTANTKANTLLIVFIHGFKGNSQSFSNFPDRLQHDLTKTLRRVKVECVVYPAYETKGELNEAVLSLNLWLATLVHRKEEENGGDYGSVKVALCGHSMGGLLMADTVLRLQRERHDDRQPLWPRIIACIGFDTPFLGLHETGLQENLTRRTEQATTIGTAIFGTLAGLTATRAAANSTANANAANNNAGWSSWLRPAAAGLGGALAVGAVAAGVYTMRNEIGTGLGWVNEHLNYVGNVFKNDELRQRTLSMIEMEEKHRVIFRVFYVTVPTIQPPHIDRTFVNIPSYHDRAYKYWRPAQNGRAEDAVMGHMAMFDPQSNDEWHRLILDTLKVIQTAVEVNP